jgi:hypothetical protein
MYFFRQTHILSIFAAALLASSAGFALPETESARPALAFADAEDSKVDLRGFNGKALVVVLENKESASQNLAFKSELAALGLSKELREGYTLVPIADVEGYDYWPARGFVKDAIRSESKKIGRTVWIDWGGSARKAFGASKDKSVVLVYGKNGKLKFAAEGPLDKVARGKALTALKCDVVSCGDSP